MGGDVLCVARPAELRDSTVTYTMLPSNNVLVPFKGNVKFVVTPTSWKERTSLAYGCLPTATRNPLIPDSSS